MAALAPMSSPWIPEDDLLLKNSIEAGASLEALAKGAVKFSRRFTIHELRDRWHSLLYDPDISAQASARMVELELSGSNPSSKLSRFDNSKGSEKIHEKRKTGSIRKHYFAMRKRIRSDLFNSHDLGFLDEPNLHNYSGHGHDFQEHVGLNNEAHVGDSLLGDCMANNLGLEETDLEILRQAFPETIGNIATNAAVDDTRNVFHTEGCQNSVADNYLNRSVREDNMYKFSEDVSPLLRNDVRSSFELIIERNDAPHLPKDDSSNFGKCMNLEEIGTSHTLPGGKLFEADESQMKQLSTYDSTNENNQILCSGFGGKQHFNSPGSDGSASFHTMGFSSPLPSLPIWKAMEDVSAPDMPVNERNGETILRGEEALTLPEDGDSRRENMPGYDVSSSGPLLRDRPEGADYITSNNVSEGEFTDLPDSLLNFSNEDELLFVDVDGIHGKETTDDTPSTLLGGDLCNVEPKFIVVLNTGPATPCAPCHRESEDMTSSVHVDQYNNCRMEVEVPSKSVSYSQSNKLPEGNIVCTLNTEDPEIPCNDDIFLLIHPATAFASPARQPIITDSIDPISSSADEKDGEPGLNLMKKGKDVGTSFLWSQMVGPNVLLEPVSVRPFVGCAVKPELPDTICPANKVLRNHSQSRSIYVPPLTNADGVLEEDATQSELRAAETAVICSEMPLHADAPTVKMTVPDSMANPSTSQHDESESDGDVPYFSDIEAMILEMDLSYDQDSCSSSRVSRYQYEDAKRTIIRLEQTARTSLQRAMTSQGALAILYGRHLKHYIRKTEVILGRSTDDTDVDIDLRKEGRANKISRRQATIKMETDGSFSLKNLGKSSISVNGKAIANGQLVTLGSSCLIEIREMSFVFEINDKYVRRYLDNLARKTQGKSNKFEWSPEEEP